MNKLLRIVSLKRLWHSLGRMFPLLASPQVPLGEKLLFIVPALVYWVVPDVMPMLPVDDIAVTLLLLNWFTDRVERKYGV